MRENRGEGKKKRARMRENRGERMRERTQREKENERE